MNDEYVPRNAQVIRAHRWLPGDAQAVVDMLKFLGEVGTFRGIEAVNDGVALDVKELSGWIHEGDWVVLESGLLKCMSNVEFREDYRKASDANA